MVQTVVSHRSAEIPFTAMACQCESPIIKAPKLGKIMGLFQIIFKSFLGHFLMHRKTTNLYFYNLKYFSRASTN
jgi:hypothetical protein